MRFLILIGIPFRFVLYVLIRIVIGLLSPDALKTIDEDWGWVITGVDKYHRNNGRQLI